MAYPTLKNNGNWLGGIPWAEYLSRRGATADGAFGYESGNQRIMTILVNFSDIEPAKEALLGYQFVTGGNISRVLPVQHIEYPWLRCTRINSIKGHGKPTKNTTATVPYTQYPFAMFTLLFTQPKWVMLSDADLDRVYGTPGGQRQEWNRYVEPMLKTNTQYISREQSNWKWSATEGPAGSPEFKGPIGQPITGQEIQFLWRRVPAQFFYTSAGVLKIPTNMLQCIETVNNATMFGYPAGTLKFSGADPRPIEQPNVVGINVNLGQPAICVDCMLTWKFTDPPSGKASSTAQGANYNSGANTRGWNLAPYIDQKWYKVVSSGDPARGIFNVADHTQIFVLS